MSDRITRADVDRLAGACNVHVATWSPGDGMTRYRFVAIEGNHTSLDYFGASGSDVLGTCLGAREAYTWLQGYRACSMREHIEPCDCAQFPAMHDSSGVCVNWELHNSKPCAHVKVLANA